MKQMKKILGIMLTMVLAVAMTIVIAPSRKVSAANFTIKMDGSGTTGHTYEIYQVFTGTVSDSGVLGEIKWGQNGKGGKEGDKVSDDILQEIQNVSTKTDAEKRKVINKYVDMTKPYATITGGGSATVPAGYYMIKDANDTLTGQNDAYTEYIFRVVKDINVQPKASIPNSKKKIKDHDDTTGSTTDWQDSADYDIGDKIPFQLEGRVADNMKSYAGKYRFVFHDKESEGLTFDSQSVKVYVDDQLITSGYEVVTNTDDNDTFDIVFDDLKNIPQVQNNSMIKVDYESLLNDKAKIGEAGNPNEMYLEFSNNPNQDSDKKPETGKTPVDKVIAFTYETVINKVDQNNKPLKGAKFTLEKKIKGEGNAEDTWKSVGEYVEVNDSTTTTFTFKGLDDGQYRLKETQTPDGYNSIHDIYFEITATHDVSSDDPKLLTLKGTNLGGGNVDRVFETDIKNGSITTKVINGSGALLPETGGIGTKIFYVVGAIFVIGAAIILITKRRMSTRK